MKIYNGLTSFDPVLAYESRPAQREPCGLQHMVEQNGSSSTREVREGGVVKKTNVVLLAKPSIPVCNEPIIMHTLCDRLIFVQEAGSIDASLIMLVITFPFQAASLPIIPRPANMKAELKLGF